MAKGFWVWPSDPKEQRKVLRKVSQAPHLLAAMNSINKSKEGMSNGELDDALADSSEWMTIWTIRQLTSLGFIDLKVDFFGNPARYQLTELGRTALSAMARQPLQPKAPTTAAPVAQPAAHI
jgi:hypothetical protein